MVLLSIIHSTHSDLHWSHHLSAPSPLHGSLTLLQPVSSPLFLGSCIHPSHPLHLLLLYHLPSNPQLTILSSQWIPPHPLASSSDINSPASLTSPIPYLPTLVTQCPIPLNFLYGISLSWFQSNLRIHIQRIHYRGQFKESSIFY